MRHLFLITTILLTLNTYSQDFPDFITRLFLADSIGTLDRLQDLHIENAIRATIHWNVGDEEEINFCLKGDYYYHYLVDNVDEEISDSVKFINSPIGYYVQTKDLVMNLGYVDNFISKGGNVLVVVWGEPKEGFQKSYHLTYDEDLLPVEYQKEIIAKSKVDFMFETTY